MRNISNLKEFYMNGHPRVPIEKVLNYYDHIKLQFRYAF